MTTSQAATRDPAMLAKAETLIEALPYLQRYAGRTFVVKYGGHAMGDPDLALDFAQDVVLLKAVGINPVVVHGGGPQIGAMLKKLGVESRFVDGLRVTDKATADIAEMVLCGSINKELVGWIANAGGKAIGMSGKDGGLVTARKVEKIMRDPDTDEMLSVDLGFVGEPDVIDTTVIDTMTAAGIIPVIAPIACGPDGETYNVNADTMAGAIAAALGAARLSDDGTISGGMIPKLETCVLAVEAGCEAAVVIDGRVSHAMLIEVFTSKGAGTLIRKA